jgi:hypothetical protein
VPGSFGIQADATPTAVKTFGSIGRANTHGVEVANLAVEKERRSLKGIGRQTQSSGEVITSTCRNYRQDDVWLVRDCIENKLKSAVAAKDKNAPAAILHRDSGLTGKIASATRYTNFHVPTALNGEPPQGRKRIACATTSGHRVDEKEVRRG